MDVLGVLFAAFFLVLAAFVGFVLVEPTWEALRYLERRYRRRDRED